MVDTEDSEGGRFPRHILLSTDAPAEIAAAEDFYSPREAAAR